MLTVVKDVSQKKMQKILLQQEVKNKTIFWVKKYKIEK